jgi:hypothetical protein
MFLVAIVQGASPRSGQRADARALPASGQGTDGRSTHSANAHTLSRVYMASMADVPDPRPAVPAHDGAANHGPLTDRAVTGRHRTKQKTG